jgi:hypothetical protein
MTAARGVIKLIPSSREIKNNCLVLSGIARGSLLAGNAAKAAIHHHAEASRRRKRLVRLRDTPGLDLDLSQGLATQMQRLVSVSIR